MESQSTVSNVKKKYCSRCNQDRPIELFQNGKTCSRCRDKKNQQNAQKRANMDALVDVRTIRITIDEFVSILETMKSQNIENFKQVIDLSGNVTLIDLKEIASHITNSILATINFKFNYKDRGVLLKLDHIAKFRYHCTQLLDRQKKPKKHEDSAKHRDYIPMQWFHCRQVTIELTHEYHAEYVDIRITNETKEYIQNNLQQPPQVLWKNISIENPNITEKQIYRWQINFSQHIWKKDKVQIKSAIEILNLHNDIEILLYISNSEVIMISFGIREIIDRIGINATEIGVDAIFDGTGVPLAYMLLTTTTAISDGIRTNMIAQFFNKLCYRGISPVFIMTDKDSAQILAAKTIWLDAYIQLCFWHMKRAIKRQLALTKKPKLTRYSSDSANSEFSFIDPNFHHNHILNLIAKHFNQHPFIPTSDNQYCSPNQIRETAVKEMYIYCKNNNLKWAWSYLWVEWYSPLKWPNWARSAKKEISVLKTTMIAESHWRLIKHNYLYKFNKPCLDLLMQKRESGSKKIMSSWHSAFKRTWKTCSKKALGGSSYITNPKTWTCSCPVQRYRSSPFLRHKDLIPLTQGLEAVDEDEDETDEVDEQIEELDKLSSDEIEEKLIETIQKYEEYKDNIDPIMVEEPNEMWEEVNDCENAINGMEKMLEK
ncbi:11567_t:CDS:2, partial [Gigaspora rosea]